MVVVFSSIKGGTGKSTLALHLAVQACLDDIEIITYDFDFPQFSFSIFYNNRKNNPSMKIWNEHYSIQDFSSLPIFPSDKLILVDTPGRYEPALMDLHKKADIIITPINDSFVDINTIMKIERERWATFGNYYEFIYDSKNFNEHLSWWVIRNRSSSVVSNHSKEIKIKLDELSKRIDFRLFDGPKDRSIYRELFNRGETILDLKSKLSISNMAAKLEIKSLWSAIFKMMQDHHPDCLQLQTKI